MKEYVVSNIKNIALAGHAGSGKTSLAEALLYQVKATDRLGKIADGNTICDYDAEEIKRKSSLNTTLTYFEYDNMKVNLLDTPGLFDFEAGVCEGIAACDTVMIPVSAKSGVKVGTEKAYARAVSNKTSTMFVITKLDDENADFYKVLEQLKSTFGPTVCPVVVPVEKDGNIQTYVNLIEMKAYTYDVSGHAVETVMPDMDHRLEGLIAAVSEAVAETDETLFEKFFSGEQFTQKEIVDGIHKAMNEGKLTPVTCVSSTTLAGVDMLLKEIVLLLPSPADRPAKTAETIEGDIVDVLPEASAPTAVHVFKTVADPFVGKLSFLRVVSGTLRANSELVNATTRASEKIGKIFNLFGKRQDEVSSAVAGDIVVASKINAKTGDTLCGAEKVLTLEPIAFPVPCYSMAVKLKAQGDESKISNGISRLLEEDPSLNYTLDAVTHEQIISGLGEQHLEICVAKLKNKFGVEVLLSNPKIAYKETITKKVKVQGRHKKQSGGHGQYGDVWIEFEPCISDELVFEERVFGGAVPKQYFPAVEKGLQDSTKRGVLAGCPVVGLKAILVDGSYHPVDSSEMAFKTAASLAYKEGLKQAEPVILEPIGKLSVLIPTENAGDIMGDLNKRRGRVLGTNPQANGMTEIEAEVPTREMQPFNTVLRQISRGKGSFSFTHVRYEKLPNNLLSEVILAISSNSDSES